MNNSKISIFKRINNLLISRSSVGIWYLSAAILVAITVFYIPLLRFQHNYTQSSQEHHITFGFSNFNSFIGTMLLFVLSQLGIALICKACDMMLNFRNKFNENPGHLGIRKSNTIFRSFIFILYIIAVLTMFAWSINNGIVKSILAFGDINNLVVRVLRILRDLFTYLSVTLIGQMFILAIYLSIDVFTLWLTRMTSNSSSGPFC